METYRVIKKNANGGSGEVILDKILTDKEMHDNCGLYAKVTINPGSELGYHEHHGESETYYILSGKGVYNDNGTERIVGPGDVTFTPNGMGHGMKPAGDEPIEFMALIIKD